MTAARLVTLSSLFLTILWGITPLAHAGGASAEWEALNKQVVELYRPGNDERAVEVAQQALQVAEPTWARSIPTWRSA
ncbi:MAG: hypothetical protein N3C12_06620 [Candidatus Binatia bacterium]|nr:hypothetical protein [Candidatus Binatia bacterium]